MGGGINHPASSATFFQRLTDGLNHAEFPIPNYDPTYFDRHITEIAFFHNLIIICKGFNNEGSNVPDVVQNEIAAVTK